MYQSNATARAAVCARSSISCRASELRFDALASRTELDEQKAQSDEDEESERIIRRQFERIRRRDEPVQNSCCADQRSEQAGSASAIPGAQDHRDNGKLIDGGALQEGKCTAEEQRKAGQHEGKAIALEHIWHLPGRSSRAARSTRNVFHLVLETDRSSLSRAVLVRWARHAGIELARRTCGSGVSASGSFSKRLRSMSSPSHAPETLCSDARLKWCAGRTRGLPPDAVQKPCLPVSRGPSLAG